MSFFFYELVCVFGINCFLGFFVFGFFFSDEKIWCKEGLN